MIPKEKKKIRCTCVLRSHVFTVIYQARIFPETTMSCTHLGQLTQLSQPKLSQSVHREECTQCFDDQVRPLCLISRLRLTNGIDRGFSQDNPLGVEVCLSCFNGGCLDSGRHHARTHVNKLGHRFSLNVKRKLKPSTKRVWLLQSLSFILSDHVHRLKMKNHQRR